MGDSVTLAREGAIATVTLNRPDRRNALGGGWGLTLACDFRWAAAEAEFWIPEVDLGVPLGVASTTRFVRLVGPARAKEIIMECRRYSAADAHAMGLLHRVVPGTSLLKEARAWGGDGMSATFAAINRNKRGIAVDLQHPEGARLAFELARRADVVVENFLPGVAERLGLGYQAVSAANPSVIYASVTGFGQTGPHARRAGYNTIAQGMSGIMALTGQPGSPPTKVGGSVADLAAAFLAFGAVNAALVHRLRTGQGQHLDVNLLASTLALLPDPVAHYFDSGTRPGRVGNRNPNLTPAEAFHTKDGWVQVVIMNPDQYARLCAVLGDDELATDPKFATNESRLVHHDELTAEVLGELGLARAEIERLAASGVVALA